MIAAGVIFRLDECDSEFISFTEVYCSFPKNNTTELHSSSSPFGGRHVQKNEASSANSKQSILENFNQNRCRFMLAVWLVAQRNISNDLLTSALQTYMNDAKFWELTFHSYFLLIKNFHSMWNLWKSWNHFHFRVLDQIQTMRLTFIRNGPESYLTIIA